MILRILIQNFAVLFGILYWLFFADMIIIYKDENTSKLYIGGF